LLVTLVVLLLGRLPDHRYLRMVIPLFHFVPLAIVARALGYLAPRFTGRGFFASFAAGLVVVGIVSTRHGPARARFSERTPLLACLEGNAGEYDLRHGLGFHWQAHLPSVLSGHRFVIRSIGTKGTIPRWHNSFAWYGAAAGEEPFTYIVVTPSFDGLAIEETFGPPTHRLMCPHTTAAVPEYAAWAPTSLEPSRLWIYEGAEKERLNRAIREQYERGKREIFAGLRREAEEVQ
jgi:hypothetical protein